MYGIACKDIGVDCASITKGASKEGAVSTGMKHIKATHMEDPKVTEMMKMPEDKMAAMVITMVKPV